MSKKVILIGIPLDLGAENLGVDVGPAALRGLGIIERLKKDVGIDAEDGGDIDCKARHELRIGDRKARYLNEIIRVNEITAKKVDQMVSNKNMVIAVGGDHSISAGTISGASAALNGELGIIYIDAHPDMNTEASTLSGNVHGMHVTAVLGFGNEKLVNIYKKGAKVKKENVLHIGAKDFDEFERAFIKKEGIKAFTINDILCDGLRPLFQSIDELSKKVRNVWLSLDLDAIDHLYSPGVGIPTIGGLTYREVSAIAQHIGKKCNIVGMDLVEYNPLRDVDGKTAELSIELIASIFGREYSWYTRYMEKNKL